MGWKEKLGELKSKYEDYKQKQRSIEQENLKKRLIKAKEEQKFLAEKSKTLKAEEAVKRTKERHFKKSTAGKFLAAASKMDFAGTTAPYFAGYSYSQPRKRKRKKTKTSIKPKKKRRKSTRARSIWDL